MPYEEEEDRGCEVKCPKGGGGCGIGSTPILLPKLKRFVAYPGAVGPPTGTDRFTRSYSTTAGSPCSPAVRQVCPPTGAFRMVKSSVVSFLKTIFGSTTILLLKIISNVI